MCKQWPLATLLSFSLEKRIYIVWENRVQTSMPPRHKPSMLNSGLAVRWHKEGISGTEIAIQLRVKCAVIQRLLECFQATGNTDERPWSGRPRCTNQRKNCFLHIAALRQRITNATRLRQEMRRAANFNISQQTVRNRLHEFGLQSRVAVVCLP